jgi:CheY-like chemotaxis protein
LLNIINDILDLSKIEAGRMTIERMPCSPREIIKEVSKFLHARAAAKGIGLRCKCDDALPEFVAGDPTRLRQVLLNLASNAVKFTSQGHVLIEAGYSRATETLVITVVDSGIGMSPDEVQRLFLPFVQADTSTTRKFGGTGLGLTICKRLANIMGGDVRVVSSQSGVGTVFQFEVAAPEVAGKVEHGPATTRNSARPPSSNDLSGKRILVAEDGPDNQKIIVFMLRKWQAEVKLVDNGALAVEAAEQAVVAGAPFDAILMDMQMPVLDGYDATRTLRSRGYTTRLWRLPRMRCRAIERNAWRRVATIISRSRLIAADCWKQCSEKYPRRCSWLEVVSASLPDAPHGASFYAYRLWFATFSSAKTYELTVAWFATTVVGLRNLGVTFQSSED